MTTENHDPISSAGDVQVNAAAVNAPLGQLDSASEDIKSGAAVLDQAIHASATELTIDAAGAIAVTLASHTVDTFADAAIDDLDTIALADTSPRSFWLTAENVARVVTLKHGVDNIYTNNGLDFALSPTRAAFVVYDGTNCMVIGVEANPVIAYGAMYQHDVGTVVTIPGANTDVIVDGFTTGLVSDMTFQNTQELKIATAGIYRTSWQLSFTTATQNREIEGGIAVNGVVDVSTTAHRKIGTASDTGSMSGVGTLSLAVDDLVQLMVRNETDGANVNAEHANVTVDLIPGTAT
ncbi:MAG: hypothetical protein KAS32_18370, partial [Candidatus Peribacteraceae bacterium]|nr:hypothetical protein [Candidatus Peribacteraceae bacterium]